MSHHSQHHTSEIQTSGRHANHGEHGTMLSYINGFVLSLIFTFIPYFMVVNKVIEGTALLAVILGFAVIQMIIQVVFFLHLGRGPKPNWNLFFFVSTIGIVLVVVGGSVLIMNNLHYNMAPSDQIKKIVNDENIYEVGGRKTGACKQTLTNHKITISENKMSPVHVDAKRCDTLTFTVSDNSTHEIAFGAHHYHEAYAGETKISVRKGRNKTITLSESGTYQFHDHTGAKATGNFTVD